MKRLSFLFGLVFLLAVAFPSPAEATFYYATVKIHPPVGSASGSGAAAWMNCGWHTSCVDPYLNNGPGIDWSPETSGRTCCVTGRTVYFRSWNYMSISAVIGDVNIRNYATDTCYEVKVDIRDQYAAVAGTVIFEHTTRSTTNAYTMSASAGGTFSGSLSAGSMVTSEKSNCPWSGIHTHEKDASGYNAFTRNVGSPSGHIPHEYDTYSNCAGDPPGTLPCKYKYLNPGSSTAVWTRSVVVTFCTPARQC